MENILYVDGIPSLNEVSDSLTHSLSLSLDVNNNHPGLDASLKVVRQFESIASVLQFGFMNTSQN